MKIAYLADHQNFIPTLSRWLLEESPDFFKDKTWEDVAELFYARLNRGRVPLALVAYEDDEPLGTVSLLEESITTHKHLTPWLAGLHVATEWRHKGIATELINALIEEARAMNIATIYVGISRAEDFYSRRGWQIVDKIIFYNKPLTIMKLDLQQQTI
jgi:GNAT superfamily N-acetyltransferase